MRESGCSMCLGMNPDILQPGERCASTSNRNLKDDRRGGRTHLVSPAMAAAAAISGRFVDVRIGNINKFGVSSFGFKRLGVAESLPVSSDWRTRNTKRETRNANSKRETMNPFRNHTGLVVHSIDPTSIRIRLFQAVSQAR